MYIIKKINGNIKSEDIPLPSKLFKNHNICINEHIFDTIILLYSSKKYENKDTTPIQITAIILFLLKELKDSFNSKNACIKNKLFLYQKVFYDIKIESMDEYILNIENNLIMGSFDFNEFNINYIKRIKNITTEIQEIGVFYPFKIDHDIFEKKDYLLEFNPLKFKRKSNFDMQVQMDKFYSKYEVNSKLDREIDSLESNFIYPSSVWSDEFAYLDPFLYLKKYNKENEILIMHVINKKNQKDLYKEFIDHIKDNHYKITNTEIMDLFKDNQIDEKIFFHELLDFLNHVQYGSIRFQHENLFNMIQSNRTKDRGSTFTELCQEISNKHSEAKYKEYREILDFFMEQKLNKNSIISDINFDNCTQEYKNTAETVFYDLQGILGVNSNLMYIYKHYLNTFKRDFKKYKFKKIHIDIIEKVIKDIIFFYKNNEGDKLSKYINSTINETYIKKHHKKNYKAIDFNFENNFIAKYKYEYDKNLFHNAISI